MRFLRLSRCLLPPHPAAFAGAAASLLLSTLLSAQVMQDPGTLPGGRRVPFPDTRSKPSQTLRPGAPSSASPSPNSPAIPTTPHASAPSLPERPAQPATVALAAGQLSVTANDSSLKQILHDLAAASGMTIDGFATDQRIFGTYGPGNPRDVLSSILEDAGYNILMVGATPDGAPRELILSVRSDAPPTPPSMMAREEDQSDFVNSNPPYVDTFTPPIERTQPEPSPRQPGVRTPQQILQELMQERQQQQQQPQ